MHIGVLGVLDFFVVGISAPFVPSENETDFVE